MDHRAIEELALVQLGRVLNGVVVPEASENLPEEDTARIEVIEANTTPPTPKPRVGGIWKGRVRIADDFDELPPDIAKALG